MRLWISLIATVLLGACASYSGAGLAPGEARLEQVEALMGPPALRWQDADGSIQLAYPRGPAGLETFMVTLGPDERLQSIATRLPPSRPCLRGLLPGQFLPRPGSHPARYFAYSFFGTAS